MNTSRDMTSSSISRRAALAGALAGSAALAAPAVTKASETISWRMVTSWPKNLPGPGVTAERLAQRITKASGGRLTVTVYAAGDIVPGLEVFDAVQGGTAQMAHTASFFWQGKVPASVFFTAMPFGLTAPEHAAWIMHGGGQALWDELYAPFGIRAYMAGNTGMQMGGWFRKEINGLEDIKGLKIRMPGLGGEVLRRLGAAPVALPPAEIFPALQSGLVDATEFLGPWSDRAQGFYRIAPYYYAPGFHEPNGTGECLIARDAFDALPADLQQIVEQACAAENAFALAESDWMNGAALDALVAEEGVQLRAYPEDVIEAARETAELVMDDAAADDAMFARILDSYRAARSRLAAWTRAGTQPYLAAR